MRRCQSRHWRIAKCLKLACSRSTRPWPFCWACWTGSWALNTSHSHASACPRPGNYLFEVVLILMVAVRNWEIPVFDFDLVFLTSLAMLLTWCSLLFVLHSGRSQIRVWLAGSCLAAAADVCADVFPSGQCLLPACGFPKAKSVNESLPQLNQEHIGPTLVSPVFEFVSNWCPKRFFELPKILKLSMRNESVHTATTAYGQDLSLLERRCTKTFWMRRRCEYVQTTFKYYRLPECGDLFSFFRLVPRTVYSGVLSSEKNWPSEQNWPFWLSGRNVMFTFSC